MNLRADRRIVAAAVIFTAVAFRHRADATVLPQLPGVRPDQVVQADPVREAAVPSRMTLIWFWASWCAPCLGHLPAYNDLVAEGARSEVEFVAVAPESPENVRRFLARVPLRGWVLADPESELASRWRIKSYPTTILVTRSGAVALRVSGELPSAGMLRSACEGRELTVPGLRDLQAQAAAPPLRELLRVRVVVSSGGGAGGIRSEVSAEPSQFRATGVTLSTLIAEAYGIEAWRIEWDVVQPSERFDVEIEVRGGDAGDWKWILRDWFAHDLGLAIESEKRVVQVYAFRGDLPSLSRPNAAQRGSGRVATTAGAIDAEDIDVENLAVVLGGILGSRFSNEIPRSDTFNVHLEWDPTDPATLIRALKRLGFTVQESTAAEDYLVVRVAVR